MVRVRKQRWNAAQSDHPFNSRTPQQEEGVRPASLFSLSRLEDLPGSRLFSSTTNPTDGADHHATGFVTDMFSDLVLQAITVCADLIKSAMEKDLKFSLGTSADAYQDVANLLVEKKVNLTVLRIDESHCHRVLTSFMQFA
ncbi:unnamed protein product [Sphagnum balticum]